MNKKYQKKEFNFININSLKKNKDFLNKNDTVIINLGKTSPF